MYKILLIDANPSFRATFSNLLRNSGYRVEVAADLREGREKFARHGADLLLLGLESDDPDSRRQARAAFDHCKMILLHPGNEQRPGGASQKNRLEDCPVFYKPFRTEEVLAAIYATLVPRSATA